MIAGILPSIASDLSVTVPVAGQLVTAFAYALSSQVLAVLFGIVNRRSLLIVAMCAFTLANPLAASARAAIGP